MMHFCSEQQIMMISVRAIKYPRQKEKRKDAVKYTILSESGKYNTTFVCNFYKLHSDY